MYEKQVWHDAPITDTPLNSVRLNHIESGVEVAANVADAAITAAAAKYVKPGDGIPASDMSSGVLSSLGKADSAVQPAGMSAAVTSAVNSAVTGLLNGAPGALDTLKELADAINDDANFAATVTAALSNKQPLSGTLTALAALTTTTFGRNLLTAADGPSVLSAIGAAASMTPVAPVAADANLVVNTITPFDASAGVRVATLPVRSASNDNLVYGVQKAPLDTSANVVTVAASGTDQFDSNVAFITLRLAGELRFIQAATIGGTRQWKVIGGNTTVSSLDSRYQALIARRPLNNRTVAVGDSITELGTDGLLYNPQNGEGWLPRICIGSRQRIRWDGIYAKGGATLINIRDTWLPQVLALSPRPGACVVFGGTNSMVVNPTSATHAANVATYLQIVEPLLAAGITPICVTIPPNDLSSGAYSASVRQWNRWVRRYAQRNGFPLIDAYTALVGANGSWKTGYSNDQLHPNSTGMKAIADQAIADGLGQFFAPNQGQLTVRDTLDLTNVFGSGSLNWGLFTTNTGGVGTGFTSSGTGSTAIVAPAVADNLVGNWQRIARASGDAGSGLIQVVTAAGLSGWSVGNTLSLSFRIRTANVSAGSFVTVGTQIGKTGGFTQNGQSVSTLKQGIVNMTQDIEGTVYVEFTIPPGAESLVLNSIIIGNTSGQTVTVDIGEVSVVNLTTNSILV